MAVSWAGLALASLLAVVLLLSAAAPAAPPASTGEEAVEALEEAVWPGSTGAPVEGGGGGVYLVVEYEPVESAPDGAEAVAVDVWLVLVNNSTRVAVFYGGPCLVPGIGWVVDPEGWSVNLTPLEGDVLRAYKPGRVGLCLTVLAIYRVEPGESMVVYKARYFVTPDFRGVLEASGWVEVEGAGRVELSAVEYVAAGPEGARG